MPAPKDPEKYALWRENLSKARKGVPKSEKHKARIRESVKAAFQNPRLRKDISERQKRKYQNPEQCKKQSEATKRSYERNPQLRASRGESNKRRREDAAFRATEDARLREQSRKIVQSGVLQDPERCRKVSVGVRAYYKNGMPENVRQKISMSVSKLYVQGILPVRSRYKSGYYHSEKAGVVHYRSSYELAYYKQLDVDRDVATYIEEPEAIEYEMDGKIRHYIPDVKVFYMDGDWKIIEIKPEYLLDDPCVVAKLDAAEKMYGERFVVVTDSDLSL